MNFWKKRVIFFIGLWIFTISVSGRETASDIISSQSEDNLLFIPEGECGEDCGINSQRLGEEIARNFLSISQVYDISFDSKLYYSEFISLGFSPKQIFMTSFTVKTNSDAVYENIKCESFKYKKFLIIEHCKHDEVSLVPHAAAPHSIGVDDALWIPISPIKFVFVKNNKIKIPYE